MINIGNDNVAVKLRDVEYVYSDFSVAFPTKNGTYFLTIKAIYKEITYQYTIVFNIGSNTEDGSIIFLGHDPNNNFALLGKKEEGCVVGILGTIAPQDPEDIINFKYIPEE
jgi:hypothetical protein